MATCRDIIRMAMLRLRQLRAGENPSGSEADDGLAALQSLYDQWTASGMFGRLNNTLITADYTAQEQDRVINDGGYTVTLPLTYSNNVPMGSYYPIWPDERVWSALQTATTRPPRDLAIIEVVAAAGVSRYLYSAPQRAWVKVTGLALGDAAPLAERSAAGLASCLAEMIGDDYGVPIGPDTAKRSALFRWGLSSRYGETRVAGMQDYF